MQPLQTKLNVITKLIRVIIILHSNNIRNRKKINTETYFIHRHKIKLIRINKLISTIYKVDTLYTSRELNKEIKLNTVKYLHTV